MSPNSRFYLDTFSSALSPASVSLHNADGKRIAQLTSIPGKIQNIMRSVDFDFFTIPLPGRTLQAMMMKPAHFDSTRPHPLLIHTYGGPGSHIVRNGWHDPRSLWYKMLLDNGILILIMDGRGASGRGTAWKHSVHKHLGDYEIRDQIDGVKWAAELPFIDKNRIGIWGWSYGGYTTIMSLLKSPELFKMGVAVAPVTDWRSYDSIYTERFMDIPESNAEGYDIGSALQIAGQLQSRLFIVHGSSDYNVHLSNTMQFIKKLQDKNKDFRLMIYPGKTHGLYGVTTRVHVYEQIHRFILENL